MTTPAILGYQLCPCGDTVLNEVAHVTGGLCGECYRRSTTRLFGEVTARAATGEPVRLRIRSPRHSPSEHRRRAKPEVRRRKRLSERDRRKLTDKARRRARIKLSEMFPDVYEILLANERSELGLPAWTAASALRAHDASETLRTLENYSRGDSTEAAS